MRAIMIGVSVFIIVITLSAVIMYVNVAKDMATTVNKGVNEWDEIDINNIMDFEGNVSINVRGIDLINFIRNNINNSNIRIKLGQFSDSYEDIVSWKNGIGNASEERLMNINPNAKLQMQKNVLSDDTIVITVIGDIWIIKQAEEGILYGDVNLDSAITLNDYNKLKAYLDFEFSDEQKKQADVNGDNVVNYVDTTLLSQYLAGNAEIKAGTGDVNLDGNINNLDSIFMTENTLTDIQRESADINLDRVVDKEDLDNLREMLIEKGIEVPLEEE